MSSTNTNREEILKRNEDALASIKDFINSKKLKLVDCLVIISELSYDISELSFDAVKKSAPNPEGISKMYDEEFDKLTEMIAGPVGKYLNEVKNNPNCVVSLFAMMQVSVNLLDVASLSLAEVTEMAMKNKEGE